MNIVICPLSVPISKKRKFIINLNNYRNASWYVLAAAKIAFHKAVREQVAELRGWDRVAVRFTLYPGTRRRTDTSNVCSIIEKFLMDATVKLGKLPDDDYLHHIKTSYHFGCVDKRCPRVDAEFIDYD